MIRKIKYFSKVSFINDVALGGPPMEGFGKLVLIYATVLSLLGSFKGDGGKNFALRIF